LIDQRVFHNVIHRPVACLGILVLSAAIAGATVKPLRHKNSSVRKAVSSRPHLELASAKSRKTKTKKVRGQQVIQEDRAREIQTALVREGYMKGEPSGLWDQSTKDAMTRYQADHGWQIKMLPDSRALIALGLGPSHQNAINAQAVAPSLPAQAPVKNSVVPENRQ
jgi:peptidoglycan hydrolase-like protein with peptidoglycan-binding domain